MTIGLDHSNPSCRCNGSVGYSYIVQYMVLLYYPDRINRPLLCRDRQCDLGSVQVLATELVVTKKSTRPTQDCNVNRSLLHNRYLFMSRRVSSPPLSLKRQRGSTNATCALIPIPASQSLTSDLILSVILFLGLLTHTFAIDSVIARVHLGILLVAVFSALPLRLHH